MNELAGQGMGGYLLEEEIGRGSMGMVYRGKQIALGREVAIKVLPRALAKDASYMARFIREAQIVAGLNHPNIVHIYDAGQEKGLLYFVMEYIQGPTIGHLLHGDGPLPQHIAAEYAAQIADALDAAYRERNVIHRDIKPENVMLDRWGKIKVMDFGLARAPGLQKITVAKKLVGSIYYASPEQIWDQELDNRSDIYALGIVLYEMVTGKRPFTGLSLPEITQAITDGTLKPPGILNRELSLKLERVILKAMARDREKRFEDAALMAQALRSLDLRPSMGLTETGRPPAPIRLANDADASTAAQSGKTQGAGHAAWGAAMPLPNTPPASPQGKGHEVHPPKRPQVRRPALIETSKTFSPANAPAIQSTPPVVYDVSPTNTTEQHVSELETSPIAAAPTRQKPSTGKKPRNLLRQLQRMFRSSSPTDSR